MVLNHCYPDIRVCVHFKIAALRGRHYYRRSFPDTVAKQLLTFDAQASKVVTHIDKASPFLSGCAKVSLS